MKINLPITQQEKPFTQGTIVTKTDLKGVITYANDAFVDMSGFDREELIGSSQNIVRHPDMPPGAFADLQTRHIDIAFLAPFLSYTQERIQPFFFPSCRGSTA